MTCGLKTPLETKNSVYKKIEKGKEGSIMGEEYFGNSQSELENAIGTELKVNGFSIEGIKISIAQVIADNNRAITTDIKKANQMSLDELIKLSNEKQ